MKKKKLSRRDFLKRGTGFGLAWAGMGLVSAPDIVRAMVGSTFSEPLNLAVAKGGDPVSNTIKAIEALGGIERFVKRGDKVTLKPNPVMTNPPEFATNTHPDVVETVARMCVQAGAREVVVVSHDALSNFEGNGTLAAASRAGARVVAATTRDLYQPVPVLRGRLLQNEEIIQDILDADVFINMPIAKDHAGSRLTLGMKNLMGINWNRNYFHQFGLHQGIADLSSVVKPHLIIMDANRVLLTNGPGGPGQTREDKTVIAGTDPVAVDTYTATLFNLTPRDVPHIQYAYELGVGEADLKKINVKEIKVQ